jgi:starch synthase
MPRYGCINERRNQLHEVIRLSGMNVIINETDHPLIIKVASIQSARMQVYFIDNDDYFQRKHVVLDEEGHLFPDNDERLIFFNRGVFETVRKLRWSPDLIYCQGWFTALAPLYLKKEYYYDPIFSRAKVVFSTYNDHFDGALDSEFAKKAVTEGVTLKDLAVAKEPSHINLNKLACQYADAVILHHKEVSDELKQFANKLGKPVLENPGEKEYINAYSEFFDNLME